MSINSFRRLVAWLALAAAVIFAGAALAQDPIRYVGAVTVADQPAQPIHMEVVLDDSRASGTFTIPGATFKVLGEVSGGNIAGRFSADGAEGTFTLRMTSELANGSFDLAGQKGVFTLHRTQADAQDALAAPPQRLDVTALQWAEDLDELVRILTREHGAPFHRVGEKSFWADVRHIKATLPGLSGPQAATALRRLSMTIGDGHTGVALLRDQARFPVTTFWFRMGRASSRPRRNCTDCSAPVSHPSTASRWRPSKSACGPTARLARMRGVTWPISPLW
jgi:hypothetical protein